MVILNQVFCQITEMEPTDVQFGLDLLQTIKEDIGIRPSRKSLDFLLSACVNAKDLERSYLVWNEYQTAGLPYNVLSYVRLVALGYLNLKIMFSSRNTFYFHAI